MALTAEDHAALDRLVQWADGAGWGDAGERPTVELTYEAEGQWFIEARSFDGHASSDITPRPGVRAKRPLADHVEVVLRRLRDYPAEQREVELRAAASRLARLIGRTPDEVLAAVAP